MKHWDCVKRAAACAALVLGLSASAQAQEDWDGAYIGLQAGYADSDLNWALNGNGWWGVANPALNRTSFSLDGETYGLHAGYNWVSGQNLLIGFDFAYNRSDATAVQRSPAFPFIDTWVVQIEDFWDLSAKVGMAREKYMFYGALGLAVADVESTATPPIDSSSGHHMGLSVGVGGAYMLASGVSLGLEYKYYDFGTDQHPSNPACGPCNVFDGRNIDLTSHVVNLKLTKHF